MASYFPKTASEKKGYETLWAVANPTGQAEIGGNQAVDFFRKSRLDMNILRQIWALSTPFGTMNVFQFYTALRYIAMAQANIAISADSLTACSEIPLEEPKFAGAGLTPLTTTDDSSQGVISPATMTPTTEGKDVEVKRIIWVELDGADSKPHKQHHRHSPHSSTSKTEHTFALQLQKRLIEEKAALAEQVRQEERRSMSEKSQMAVVNSEVHSLEEQLHLYKSQLENAKGAHQNIQSELARREADKRRLHEQVQETQRELQRIQLEREEALRKAEESAKSEQAAREIKALEDRLQRLKLNLDGAKLQQQQAEDLLQLKFREREQLKQQVVDIQRSMSSSRGEEDFYRPTVIAGPALLSPKADREKQQLLQQISEARRILVRTDSASKDSSQEISTLRAILADLNEDIRAKQQLLQSEAPLSSEDEKRQILGQISEARARLTNAPDTPTGSKSADGRSARRELKGFVVRSDPVMAGAGSSIDSAAVGSSAMETEVVGVVDSAEDMAEKGRLIQTIVGLTEMNSQDAGLIRENTAKLSELERERGRVNEQLAQADASSRDAGKSSTALNEELAVLRKDSNRLSEERATMEAERQRSQARIDAYAAELENSRRLLTEAEAREAQQQAQRTEMEREKESLIETIAAIKVDLSKLTKDMSKLAFETKELELERLASQDKIAAYDSNPRESEDATLAAEVAALRDQMMRLEQDNIAMVAEIDKMKVKLDTNRASAQDSARALDRKKSDLDAAAAELARLAKTKEELEQAVGAARQNVDDANKQLADVSRDLEAVNAHKAKVAANAVEVDKELAGMLGESSTLTSRIADLRFLSGQLEAEREALADQLGSQNQEVSSVAEQLARDSASLDQKLGDLSLKRQILEAFQNESKDLLSKIDEMRTQIAAAEQEHDFSQGAVGDAVAKSQEVRAQLDTANAEIAALEQEANALDAQKTAAQDQLTELRAQVAVTAKTIAANSDHSAGLEDERAAMEEALQTATETAFVLSKNNDEVRAELAALDEIARALESEAQKFSVELSAVDDKRNVIVDDIAALKGRLAEKEAEVASLRIEEQALNDSRVASNEANDALRAQVEKGTENVHGLGHELDVLVDERSHLENQLRTASETAFVIATNNAEIQTEIGALQSILASLNRELDDYAPELDSLKGKVDDATAALVADKENLENKLNELDALKAEEEQLKANQSALQQEIESARTRVSDAAQTALHQNDQLNNAEDERGRVHHDLNSTEATMFMLQSGNKELLSEIDHLNSILQSLEEEKQSIAAEMDRLMNRHDESNSTVAELKAKLATKQAEQRALEAEGVRLAEDKQALDAAIAAKRVEVSNASSDAYQATDKLNNADDEKAAVEHQLNSVHEQSFDAAEANKELENEIVAGQQVLEALRDELKKVQDELGRIGLEHNSASDQVTEGQAAVQQKLAELAALKETGDKLAAEKEQLEAAISDMRDTVASVTQEVLRASEALNNSGEIVASLEHQLNDLREEAFLTAQGNEELQSELKAKQEILDALKDELKAIQDELGRIGDHHGDAYQVQLQKRRELENKQQDVDGLKAKAVDLREAVANIEEDIATKRDEIAALTDQIALFKSRGCDLLEHNDALQADCDELDAEIAVRQEEIDRLQNQFNELNAALDELLAECAAASADLIACQEAAVKKERKRTANIDAAEAKAEEIRRQKALAAAIEQETADVQNKLLKGQEALTNMGISKQMLEDGLLSIELDRLRSLCATAKKANNNAIQARLERDEAVALDNRRRNAGLNKSTGSFIVDDIPAPELSSSPVGESKGCDEVEGLVMDAKKPRRSSQLNPAFASGKHHQPMEPIHSATSESMNETTTPTVQECADDAIDHHAHPHPDASVVGVDAESAGPLNESKESSSPSKPRRSSQMDPAYASGPQECSFADEVIDHLPHQVTEEAAAEPATPQFQLQQPSPVDDAARRKDADTLARANRLVEQRRRALMEQQSLGADPNSQYQYGLTPTRSGHSRLQHVDVYPVVAPGSSGLGSSGLFSGGSPNSGFSTSPGSANYRRQSSSRRSEGGGGFDLISNLLVGNDERV